VEGQLEDLLMLPPSDDYVFVRLTDATSVSSPMERIRTVFPHAMHVERKILRQEKPSELQVVEAEKLEDIDLFRSFFTDIIGIQPDEDTERLFTEMLQELLDKERETVK